MCVYVLCPVIKTCKLRQLKMQARPLTKRQEVIATKKQEEAAATLAGARQHSPLPVIVSPPFLPLMPLFKLAEKKTCRDWINKKNVQFPLFTNGTVHQKCISGIVQLHYSRLAKII